MVGARDALRSLTSTVLGGLPGAGPAGQASDLERELAHLGG
jgi:hypothetical protein